jgi:ABC-type transport system substrate-binding protein
MFKKNFIIGMAFFVLASLIVIPNNALASINPANPPKNPYELVIDVPVGAGGDSVDPAMGNVFVPWHVCEVPIGFDGERYDVFIPLIATQAWIGPPQNNPEYGPTSPPYTNYTIYFKIRTGIPFHSRCRSDEIFIFKQYYLTTADVEYSIERVLVHDYVTSWTTVYLYEPLLNCYGGDPTDPTFGTKIDNAVQSNETHVWLNIANPGLAAGSPVSFAPVKMFETENGRFSTTFWNEIANLPLGYPVRIILQVIAETWIGVISKQWVLDFVIPWGNEHNIDLNPDVEGIQFEWDGDFSHWADYWHWPDSPLDRIGTLHPGVVIGTGPYILDRWDATPTGEVSLVKFDEYWGGWPAKYPSPPYSPQPSSGLKPAGYVTRVTMKRKTEASIISDLIAGDCDLAPEISRPGCASLHEGYDLKGPTLPGIRLHFYPFLEVMSYHFTFLIQPTLDNRYGRILANDTLREDAIPANFFNDTHVRKAFAYLINYTMIINDLLFGEAYQPVTCAPSGLPYVDVNQPHYTQNIGKAVEEFNLAFNGQLAEKGFTIKLYYITFDIWPAISDDLAATINKIGNEYFGGKFHAESHELSSTEFYTAWYEHQLAAYPMGWIGDYADIHNFIVCYMCSTGYWAYGSVYSNPEADELIQKGLRTPDGPQRQAIYKRLQEIYYEDVPSVPTHVEVRRWYARTWVQGNQPTHPLYTTTFGYVHWKWEYIRGNVNYDDKVFMDDILVILDAFGSYYGKANIPIMHPRWNFHCDVDGNPFDSWRDRKIDMYDITAALDNFGKTQTTWQPPP